VINRTHALRGGAQETPRALPIVERLLFEIAGNILRGNHLPKSLRKYESVRRQWSPQACFSLIFQTFGYWQAMRIACYLMLPTYLRFLLYEEMVPTAWTAVLVLVGVSRIEVEQ
jgi:hypothetical protein